MSQYYTRATAIANYEVKIHFRCAKCGKEVDLIRYLTYSDMGHASGISNNEADAKAKSAASSEGGIVITGEGDPAIDALVLARAEAKKAKNFAEADRIRDELKAQGIEVTDTKDGASWRRI